MRTWESNDVGNTPPFGGNVETALRSIKVPVLYMPSAHRPVLSGDRRPLRSRLHSTLQLLPIIPLCGDIPPAPAHRRRTVKFLNEHVAGFLADIAKH